MKSLVASHNLGTSINLTCNKIRFSQTLQVKAQSYRDRHEGKSSDMIDTNIRVLRMRIEEAKKKERLERCFVAEQGWNYTATHTFKGKTKTNNEIIQVLGMVGATFGLTLLSCSSCLCLASLLLHLNQ